MPRKGVWTPEAVAKLGTVSDYELGRELGVTGDAVQRARTRRGIPAAPATEPGYTRPGFGERLRGIMVDIGRSVWTDEHVAMLGTMPDGSLGELLGISKAAVREARHSRGIPPHQSPPRQRGRQNSVWTKARVDLLGRMSDSDVATIVGVSRSAVTQARQQRGIPAWRQVSPPGTAPLRGIPVVGRGGRPVVDLTGQRFGRLVVIERGPPHPTSLNAAWRCRCDCGNETVVLSNHLRAGTTVSCGCYGASGEQTVQATKEYWMRKRKRRRRRRR